MSVFIIPPTDADRIADLSPKKNLKVFSGSSIGVSFMGIEYPILVDGKIFRTYARFEDAQAEARWVKRYLNGDIQRETDERRAMDAYLFEQAKRRYGLA